MTITPITPLRGRVPKCCPSWCLFSGVHVDGACYSAGRRTTLSEPEIELRRGGIRDDILINGWRRSDSDACVALRVGTGRVRHLTAVEAVTIAADLLAAVDEAQGEEWLRISEYLAARDHAEELLAVRRAQIRGVKPDDGQIIDFSEHKYFFCQACGTWIKSPDRRAPRRAQLEHRATH